MNLESLMDYGKLFQAVGSATVKERSPILDVCYLSDQINRYGLQIIRQFDFEWLPSGCKIKQCRMGPAHVATYTSEGCIWRWFSEIHTASIISPSEDWNMIMMTASFYQYCCNVQHWFLDAIMLVPRNYRQNAVAVIHTRDNKTETSM